jgi:hypothetical protein
MGGYQPRSKSLLIEHGINELRSNNCPSSLYKDDYSHYSWYKILNLFEKNSKIDSMGSLFTLYFLFVRIQEKMQEKLASAPSYISRKMPSFQRTDDISRKDTTALCWWPKFSGFATSKPIPCFPNLCGTLKIGNIPPP